ncbi:MAG: zinc dependent phospholipase C family protein [Lachnospiraceae bacterium]|nr:zinc dependent phospholipase C family protein [Lachnospiraceae bacterium]
MPSCYAHRKFGIEVFKSLTSDTKELIRQNLPLYLIGLHGPDLLFYHRFGAGTTVAAFGRKLHHTEFAEFYANASMVIRNSEDDRQLVYYYGVLCHLFLDAYCHPIVNGRKDEIGVSHGKLEMEYERFLMERDGKDPLKFKAAGHIAVYREYAEVIAPFYLGITADEIMECLIGMKASLHLTRTSNPFLRKFVCSVCDIADKENMVASLLLTKERSDACRPVLKELQAAFDDAVEPTARAIEEYQEYLFRKIELPEYTEYTFGGRPVREVETP